MTYEIWDFETGNATGVYPSLLDALQVVRVALERNGEATLVGLALLEVRAGGERRLIAQEQDLVPLVGAEIQQVAGGPSIEELTERIRRRGSTRPRQSSAEVIRRQRDE